MSNPRISLLALLVALGVSSPAHAQTTSETAPAEASPAEGSPDMSMTPGGLDMGTDINAEPQPGQGYTAQAFESWEQVCFKSEVEGGDICQLSALLKDTDGNTFGEMLIFELVGGPSGEAVAGADILLPLGVDLSQGLLLAVDAAKPKGYGFSVCTQGGCMVRLGMTAAEIAGFKRGAKATLAFLPFGQGGEPQPIVMEVSLKGFTAGYDAVAANNKEAQPKLEAAAKAAAEAAAAAPAAPAEAAPAAQ